MQDQYIFYIQAFTVHPNRICSLFNLNKNDMSRTDKQIWSPKMVDFEGFIQWILITKRKNSPCKTMQCHILQAFTLSKSQSASDKLEPLLT